MVKYTLTNALMRVQSAQFSPLELPYWFPDFSINTYFSLRTVAILHIATFTKYYVLFNFHGNHVVTLWKRRIILQLIIKLFFSEDTYSVLLGCGCHWRRHKFWHIKRSILLLNKRICTCIVSKNTQIFDIETFTIIYNVDVMWHLLCHTLCQGKLA